ncbi:MAG: alpha-D-ribose 1-methylphosphonate 5-triphosphate diphosphatase [Pseudomonadota bacterium]
MTIGEPGWVLHAGAVLDGDRFHDRPLHFGTGRVVDTPVAPAAARAFDAAGLLIVPGMVDVHGDAFERNIAPRPGVTFDLGAALIETDRQLVANGITTAYLAVTVSWEPGLRSLATAVELMHALERVRPSLIVDLRVQIRWEITATEAVDSVCRWLSTQPTPTLAFNDHFTTLLGNPREVAKLPLYAARSGLSPGAYRAQLKRVISQGDAIDRAVKRIANVARTRGVPMFAHDETSIDMRRHYRALGVAVCEFPLTVDTAREARAHGEAVVLGAPNVVRGGSHTGAVHAGGAIADGLCTVLSTDYHYPALFGAAATLAGNDLARLAEAWALVSRNAAVAVGLSDRGTLALGQRADAIALNWTAHGPSINAVFVRGRPVFLSEPERVQRTL